MYGHGGIAPSWRGGNQPTPQLTWSRRVTRATRVAGWPRWVRGAPRSRAKGAGRPFFPFGAAMATSLGRIATPRGTCHGERAVLGRHGEVRGILISILGWSRPSLYGSGRGRVSIARPAHPPFWCTPRRSLCPPRCAAKSRARIRHARSSPTQTACGGNPRSQRPPGCRVEAYVTLLTYLLTSLSYKFTVR